ncbi:PREDICTED: uncharacterized protein LOC109149593 [Ipomoea nil]|uniref:uncharacterized protein LOC109149593 n=1 Tax=Ipomoea nil TaxID=35883 RepID=UPI0009015C0D|nr:PREDICTED: uncharacterized protein LOC109149593 [Ipomoea nil]
MESKTLASMEPNLQSPAAKSPAPQLPPPSTPQSSQVLRQWRPAAQRNIKNQWLKLVSLWKDWLSYSSSARSHATSLVNSYLSQRYMDGMELGVLSDMPDIRKKACHKLSRQQVTNRSNLLSSYKNMVGIVTQMVNTSRSMRCYLKGTSSSPIIQFSSNQDNQNDTGDGGGVPVFTFLAITSFEKMAEELVQMLKSEIGLKRLLVMEFCSISDEDNNSIVWSEELYPGEFDDLIICGLYSDEASELIFPGDASYKSDMPTNLSGHQEERNVLQVYLTTWLAEVNIDRLRIDEIFGIVGEEVHITLS